MNDYETFFSGPKNEIITHRFANNVEVVVNLEEGTLRLFKDNQCKNTCSISSYTAELYQTYLIGVSKNAKTL